MLLWKLLWCMSMFAIVMNMLIKNQPCNGWVAGVDVSNTSVRAYLIDLNKELDALTSAQTKLTNVINLLSQVNGTNDILAIRRKQSQKIQSAIDQITIERNAINSKCNISQGDNCNEGCFTGYIGSDCSQMACFGVLPTNASVCSGRGKCIGPDVCNCSYPFFGNNCQSNNITYLAYTASVGYKYTDGKYARSCNEYRFPSIPYVYNNEGSGLYQIKPVSLIITVYCDMTTDGGGWTLFAGIRLDYKGVHFHVFDDNTAVAMSETSSFHISTNELMSVSKQVRAVTDKSTLAVTSFYTSSWPYSAACDIPDLLRADIAYTRTIPYTSLTVVNPDRAANCTIHSGTQVVPTHMSYSKATNGQSIGFRMGRPYDGPEKYQSHMSQTQSIFVTFTYYGAPEGGYAYEAPGVYYNGEAITWRNGALFLR